MKYCHDCLTPIKTDSKEEYCNFCKRDRALKEPIGNENTDNK